MHTIEQSKVAHECDVWWTDHCVYLSPVARDAFITAVRAANHHKVLLMPPRPIDKIEANWKKIEGAGDAIMQGAELPPLPSEAVPSGPAQ